MVQCDDCDGWNHFSCVGVNQSVESKKWNCEKCKAKKKKAGDIKDPKNAALRKKVDKPKPEKNNIATKKENSQLKKPIREPSKAASVTSAGSRKSAKAHLELQLQRLVAEQTLLEEKKKLMEKHFSILEELVDLEDEEAAEEENDANAKVENWLGAAGAKRQEDEPNSTSEEEGCSDDEEEEEGGEKDSSDDSKEETETDSSDDSSEDEKGGSNDFSFNPKGRSTPAKKGESKRKDASSNRLTWNLTRNQLAARHVVAKDLPLFSGNPEEWPMFFSTFESTTRMCGYTDDENMIRLRNCLKGDAFAAVRSFLLHPKTVNRAMDALKLKFGQPRFIIESLKDKVLAIPPVDSESMNAMVDFALDVQNLTVMIDACGRKELKQDASLLNSLVSKLPGPMQLQWAKHSRSIRKVNLKTFGKWIYEIGEDACLVSKPRQPKVPSHNQEPRRRAQAYVNAHVEHQGEYRAHFPGGSTSSAGARRTCPTACIVCRGSCSSLANCQGFRELSYDGRWAITREAKMCRKCLKRHRGGCVSRNCGVNGCTCKHHPLLHKQLNPESAPMQPNAEFTPIQTGDNVQREERSCHTHLSGSSAVLFRYVPVVVYGNGIVIHCYAFLDDGSSLTLMDQDLADELNLAGKSCPLSLKWTGDTRRIEDNSQIVSLEVSGLTGERFHMGDVRTVSGLQLPPQTLDAKQLQAENTYLRGIPLESYHSIQPRLLIGVQHANMTLVRESREGKPGQPIAVKTDLGWTIYSGASNGEALSMVHYTYHITSCDHKTESNAAEEHERDVHYPNGESKATACTRSPAVDGPPVDSSVTSSTRPFAHVNIDLLEKREVAKGSRVEKRLGGPLFCLSILGVYLLLASSLTSNLCSDSNWETNFVGIDRALKEALQAVYQHKMIQELCLVSTTYCFNLPAAPHMGGSWGQFVQSVKQTLAELQSPYRSKEDELRSASVGVESIFNGRPLTYVPIEDEAVPALTRNHWLVGSFHVIKL
ncbi:uncharacterized protein LOC129752820 [Uranotaenia lowii]|uniref:uncharacterized protein LOC129752820 n=1 Tax=Uranotaenia lowii TaxID=190385 RepID=UPI00247B01FD|nr:uncharacterized protein LOC129752820 [Uranotaenia lowii]